MIDVISLDPTEIGGDVFVGCVGYEHRSIEALRKNDTAKDARHKFLFSYESHSAQSFDQNLKHAGEAGCLIFPGFDEFLVAIARCVSAMDGASIVLDVTSFDRKKMARVLELIFELREVVGSVTVLYYPREYSPPPTDLEEVLQFGPVTPKFVGEVSYEREHLSLIVGAGYEFGRVVGAIDVLEPEVTYCLVPSGPDPRFEQSVMKNNLDFRFLDNPDLLMSYDVERPDQLFFYLRRLIEVEVGERNVLILPLGPKIFAAMSILVALIYNPAVMVWRHSTVSIKAPSSIVDAKASGHVASFAFRFV